MAKLYKIGDKVHKIETQEDGTNQLTAIMEIDEVINRWGNAVMAILTENVKYIILILMIIFNF